MPSLKIASISVGIASSPTHAGFIGSRSSVLCSVPATTAIPACRIAATYSLNTSALGSEKALSLLTGETARLGMPVADPMRGGDLFDKLVESCLAE